MQAGPSIQVFLHILFTFVPKRRKLGGPFGKKAGKKKVVPTVPGKNCGYSVSGIASVTGLAALALIVGVVSATFVRAGNDARDVIALAVPDVPLRLGWDRERRAFAARLTRGYGIQDDDAVEFAGWILEASVRQELEPELLASLVMTESSFRQGRPLDHGRGGTGPGSTGSLAPVLRCRPKRPRAEPVLRSVDSGLLPRCLRPRKPIHPPSAEECALRAYNVGFRNRNNVYFVDAAKRYLAKIDRYREPLSES